MGHRRDVELHQDVVGQVALDVQHQLLVEREGQLFGASIEGGRAEQVGALPGEQHLAHGFVEAQAPEVVAAAGRGGQHVHEAAQARAEAALALGARVGRGQVERPAQGRRPGRRQALGQGQGAVAVVAGEVLVAAVAGEHHLHVAAGQAAHQEGGQRAAVGEGFSVMLQQVVDQRERVGLHDLHVVVGAKGARHGQGVGALVVGALVPADGEGLDRAVVVAGHERHDRGRVEAPREQRAQGHVGHEPAAHRGVEQLAHRVGGLVEARGEPGVGARGQAPPAHGLQLGRRAARAEALGLHHQHVARGQLLRAHPGRARVRHRAEGKVVRQGLPVGRAVQARLVAQSLQLAGEGDALPVGRPGQGLLPHPVPGQHQTARAGVPQREGEHALQPLQEAVALARPPLAIGRQDHLVVAAPGEAVPPGGQLVTQRGVVVDLAVGHQHQARVVARHHRLGAGRRQVHDGQAAMTQGDGAVAPQAHPVRAAVALGRGHGRHDLAVGRSRRVEPELARQAAHGRSAPPHPARPCCRAIRRAAP